MTKKTFNNQSGSSSSKFRSNKSEYQKNSIVFAGTIGHPPWPAKIIQKVDNDIYKVDFIGVKYYANVSYSQLQPFNPKEINSVLRNNKSHKKYKSLVQSIQKAQKLLQIRNNEKVSKVSSHSSSQKKQNIKPINKKKPIHKKPKSLKVSSKVSQEEQFKSSSQDVFQQEINIKKDSQSYSHSQPLSRLKKHSQKPISKVSHRKETRKHKKQIVCESQEDVQQQLQRFQSSQSQNSTDKKKNKYELRNPQTRKKRYNYSQRPKQVQNVLLSNKGQITPKYQQNVEHHEYELRNRKVQTPSPQTRQNKKMIIQEQQMQDIFVQEQQQVFSQQQSIQQSKSKQLQKQQIVQKPKNKSVKSSQNQKSKSQSIKNLEKQRLLEQRQKNKQKLKQNLKKIKKYKQQLQQRFSQSQSNLSQQQQQQSSQIKYKYLNKQLSQQCQHLSSSKSQSHQNYNNSFQSSLLSQHPLSQSLPSQPHLPRPKDILISNRQFIKNYCKYKKTQDKLAINLNSISLKLKIKPINQNVIKYQTILNNIYQCKYIEIQRKEEGMRKQGQGNKDNNNYNKNNNNNKNSNKDNNSIEQESKFQQERKINEGQYDLQRQQGKRNRANDNDNNKFNENNNNSNVQDQYHEMSNNNSNTNLNMIQRQPQITSEIIVQQSQQFSSNQLSSQSKLESIPQIAITDPPKPLISEQPLYLYFMSTQKLTPSKQTNEKFDNKKSFRHINCHQEQQQLSHKLGGKQIRLVKTFQQMGQDQLNSLNKYWEKKVNRYMNSLKNYDKKQKEQQFTIVKPLSEQELRIQDKWKLTHMNKMKFMIAQIEKYYKSQIEPKLSTHQINYSSVHQIQPPIRNKSNISLPSPNKSSISKYISSSSPKLQSHQQQRSQSSSSSVQEEQQLVKYKPKNNSHLTSIISPYNNNMKSQQGSLLLQSTLLKYREHRMNKNIQCYRERYQGVWLGQEVNRISLENKYKHFSKKQLALSVKEIIDKYAMRLEKMQLSAKLSKNNEISKKMKQLGQIYEEIQFQNMQSQKILSISTTYFLMYFQLIPLRELVQNNVILSILALISNYFTQNQYPYRVILTLILDQLSITLNIDRKSPNSHKNELQNLALSLSKQKWLKIYKKLETFCSYEIIQNFYSQLVEFKKQVKILYFKHVTQTQNLYKRELKKHDPLSHYDMDMKQGVKQKLSQEPEMIKSDQKDSSHALKYIVKNNTKIVQLLKRIDMIKPIFYHLQDQLQQIKTVNNSSPQQHNFSQINSEEQQKMINQD